MASLQAEPTANHVDNSSGSALFDGISFWLSSTVPQRSQFKKLIERHGGNVVRLEKDADYRLVDHTKKDLAPGTYSYQFVERSIRNNKLENPEDHRVGPSPNRIRPVGSTTIRPRDHRRVFTAKDDQILYDWVKPYELAGGKWSGNKIYQQLAEKYPHHTFQSWRNRYIKKVRNLPRPVTMNASIREANHEPESTYEQFTASDKEMLLAEAEDILNVKPSLEDTAWSKFAEANPKHSASEWKNYFHSFVRPEYVKKKRKRSSSSHASPLSSQRSTRSSVVNEGEVTKGPVYAQREQIEQGQKAHKASSTRKRNRSTPSPRQTAQERSPTATSEEGQFETAPQFSAVRSTRQSQEADTSEDLDDTTIYDILTTSAYRDDNLNESEVEDVQHLDKWIQSRVESGKAANERQVMEALHSTTMDPNLADQILPYLKAGEGIPENIRGVWTAEDDRCLEGQNAKLIEDLEKKHGTDAVIRRTEHLNLWKKEMGNEV
ncbi:hypothetical protein VTO42DRAFT_8266 [Malbranchea cinnamomea]